MAKKFVFSLSGDLPADEMDAAEVLGKIKPARDAFVAALNEAGVTHVHSTKVANERAPSDKPREARTPRVAAAA